MSLQEWKRQFEKKFTSLISNCNKNRYEVFRDWAYVAAITCHQSPVNLGILPKDETYDRFENLYLERVKKYDRDSLQVFAEMFAIVQLALNEHKTDFIGQLHQELSVGWQKDKGQFFTPYAVAKVTAQMILNKESVDRLIKKKGYVIVGEPTVGAGSFLIAAAEVIEELGYDPRKNMYFEGTDIDQLCCDMTYIQMSVLGIPGFVIHGNTLSMEVWESRPTPQLQLIQKRGQIDPMYKLLAVIQQMEGNNIPSEGNNVSPEEKKLEGKEVQETEQEAQVQQEYDFTPRQLNLFEDF